MSHLIFINLPVADVTVATGFYEAIGFTKDERFSDATTSGMALDDHIHVMLLEHGTFAGFLEGTTIADRSSTEVLNALLLGSREEVDRVVAAALDHGGRPWRPTEAQGEMYGGSFQDPDGHVWELFTLTG